MRVPRTLGLLALYVGAQCVALALAFPFRNLGLTTTSNPSSIGDILPYLVVIVVAPLGIILLSRKAPNFLVLLKWLLLMAISASLLVTLGPAFYLILPRPLFFTWGWDLDFSVFFSTAIAVGAFLTLLIEPQWYVVDTVGFLAAGSLIALLGISLGIFPVLVLLIALLIYDAIAVYGTKHMLTLADAVTDMKLPILMVMPEGPGYDYTAVKSLSEHRTSVKNAPQEREATFMGLGDVVIPGVLVVSAYAFLPVHVLATGIDSNLVVAFGAMAGSLVGYSILMWLVGRGNPQAGLPLLNGGAIGGYILLYVLLYHSLTLGIVWPPW